MTTNRGADSKKDPPIRAEVDGHRLVIAAGVFVPTPAVIRVAAVVVWAIPALTRGLIFVISTSFLDCLGLFRLLVPLQHKLDGFIPVRVKVTPVGLVVIAAGAEIVPFVAPRPDLGRIRLAGCDVAAGEELYAVFMRQLLV